MVSAEISVVVPTFNRPQELTACLRALTRQTAVPTEVIVVVRGGDAESRAVASGFEVSLPLRVVTVSSPGQVQALNCGLSWVRTPLVAITDDDAQPREEWLERIVSHFQDSSVGAVGGRDVVHHGERLDDGHAERVGRVAWYGRVLGNHHLDSKCQEVEFLKGVNMSYRREALPGFDEHLAGDGSQICNDMQASLRVHAAGWRVIWDPGVVVDHFPAERFDEDSRTAPTIRAIANILHNQTYILLSLLPAPKRPLTLLYALCVGTRFAPGILLLPWAIASSRSLERSMFGFRANLYGRFRGVATFARTRGVPRFPPELAQHCLALRSTSG